MVWNDQKNKKGNDEFFPGLLERECLTWLIPRSVVTQVLPPDGQQQLPNTRNGLETSMEL